MGFLRQIWRVRLACSGLLILVLAGCDLLDPEVSEAPPTEVTQEVEAIQLDPEDNQSINLDWLENQEGFIELAVPTGYQLSLGGEDAGLFELLDGSLLQFVLPPDFEYLSSANGDATFELTLVLTSDSGERRERSLSITLVDLFEVVQFQSLAEALLSGTPETAGSALYAYIGFGQTRVGEFRLNDAQGQPAAVESYQLLGADAEFFQIINNQQIEFIEAPSFAEPLDADGDNRYEFSLLLTDTNGNQARLYVIAEVVNQDLLSPSFAAASYSFDLSEFPAVEPLFMVAFDNWQLAGDDFTLVANEAGCEAFFVVIPLPFANTFKYQLTLNENETLTALLAACAMPLDMRLTVADLDGNTASTQISVNGDQTSPGFELDMLSIDLLELLDNSLSIEVSDDLQIDPNNYLLSTERQGCIDYFSVATEQSDSGVSFILSLELERYEGQYVFEDLAAAVEACGPSPLTLSLSVFDIAGNSASSDIRVVWDDSVQIEVTNPEGNLLELMPGEEGRFEFQIESDWPTFSPTLNGPDADWFEIEMLDEYNGYIIPRLQDVVVNTQSGLATAAVSSGDSFLSNYNLCDPLDSNNDNSFQVTLGVESIAAVEITQAFSLAVVAEPGTMGPELNENSPDIFTSGDPVPTPICVAQTDAGLQVAIPQLLGSPDNGGYLPVEQLMAGPILFNSSCVFASGAEGFYPRAFIISETGEALSEFTTQTQSSVENEGRGYRTEFGFTQQYLESAVAEAGLLNPETSQQFEQLVSLEIQDPYGSILIPLQVIVQGEGKALDIDYEQPFVCPAYPPVSGDPSPEVP